MVASLEEATRRLNKLQALGVGLALDDFGTGYSSLTYLQRLPFNVLKIDKTFIDRILPGELQPTLIGAIIDMAHIMHMTVVAEGVEEEQQLQYLAQHHCDLVQGYFISRPLPEERVADFLDERFGRPGY